MAMDPKRKTVFTLLGVVFTMGALAWASVPLYSWFCAVTGFGGVTQVAEKAGDEILDREITVRFDANTDKSLPWTFKPVEREITLRIGEEGLAFYEAYNPTSQPVAGQATYNVTPYEAGGFFNKIQCFCFTEQVLQPGERVMMPVSFFVDPAIVEDRDAKYINHITLSYTFYRKDLPEAEQALLDAGTDGEKTVN